LQIKERALYKNQFRAIADGVQHDRNDGAETSFRVLLLNFLVNGALGALANQAPAGPQ
jgi:hypothetical protein